MREVYVLGAGASKAHGAPLTDEILPWAFTKRTGVNQRRLTMVADFLEKVFRFRAGSTMRNWRACPGLTETMSVVDMAIDRGERLHRAYGKKQLRSVRENLEYLIFKTLDFGLSHRNRERTGIDSMWRLCQRLDPHDSTVISFNYDILIDVQLVHRADHIDAFDSGALGRRKHLPIDYGVEFRSAAPLPNDAFKLLKLHGSFNWFWDPVTGDLIYGGTKKAIGEIYAGGRAAQKGWEPILVTPTHLKDLRNYHLAQLWRKAEQELRQADKITFIGYSMPGDDMHIKYLFKRALRTRKGDPPKIVVVDWVDPVERRRLKRKKQKPEVQLAYERFFGAKDLKFHNIGFKVWADGYLR